MKRTFLIAIVAVVLSPSLLRADPWYVSYGKGLEAFKRQQWQQAIGYLNDAVDEKSDSKANAKTYGLQFIDYFPYLYRGVAYFKLGDRKNALSDLGKAESEGAVNDAEEDTEAPKLLHEYLDLLRKNVPPTDPAFADGMKLFNQKDFKGAVEQFKSVPESSPQYREAVKYLGLSQAEVKKTETAAAMKDKKDRIDKAFASGVQYFNQNDLEKAGEQFTSVLQLDNSRSDARQYLDRIRTLRQKSVSGPAAKAEIPKRASKETLREPLPSTEKPSADTTALVLFRDAVSLFGSGKIGEARGKFAELKRVDPSRADADEYLRRIDIIEEQARRGITAFFEGDYLQAIEQLSESLKGDTSDPRLYAFLASSYAARYLLTGGEDEALRQNALDAFGKVKKMNAVYRLDGKFVSPKIIALLTGQ